MAGPVIYAEAPPDNTAVQNAKDWIKEKGLTSSEVKLYKTKDSVNVIAIVNLEGKI